MIRSQIPKSLWQDDTLLIPPALVDPLRDELKGRALYEEACVEDKPDNELFGGKDAEAALPHFTHRFKASAARVEFVALNPNGTFEPLATDLLACLLDGSVAILDIPCGSGGGLLGLLLTFVELRRHEAVPRLPLEIRLLAADISAEARAIHEAMLRRVQGALAELGISVAWEYMAWDVTDPFSTTALMDRWLAFAPASEEYLVFISAFSGFAASNADVVLQGVRDITVRLHNKTFLLAWIEPIMKKSERLFEKVLGFLTGLFRGRPVTGCQPLGEEFKYRHPFTEQVLPGRARVVRFEKVQT
jgi:hypothetical protein